MLLVVYQLIGMYFTPIHRYGKINRHVTQNSIYLSITSGPISFQYYIKFSLLYKEPCSEMKKSVAVDDEPDEMEYLNQNQLILVINFKVKLILPGTSLII